MKKIFVLLTALMPLVAMADEAPKEDKFNLNVRRIGLDWTKTDIHNPGEYQNSTVAALKASDQTNIQGVFDVALEYGHDRFNRRLADLGIRISKIIFIYTNNI